MLLDRLLLPDFVSEVLAFGVKRCDGPMSTSGGKEMARARGIRREGTLTVFFARTRENDAEENTRKVVKMVVVDFGWGALKRRERERKREKVREPNEGKGAKPKRSKYPSQKTVRAKKRAPGKKRETRES